jgi:hypothetical protein
MLCRICTSWWSVGVYAVVILRHMRELPKTEIYVVMIAVGVLSLTRVHHLVMG